MNSLKYKGYTARIDFDPEDEIFTGRVIGIKDVNINPQKSFSGKFVIRLSPEIHEKPQ